MLIYNFPGPLIKGVIISRPNRFLMEVKFNTETILCHCPVTGKIGSIKFTGIPCLVSRHKVPKRKHSHTVEAIYVCHHWVGINQTRINEFVEYYLRSGAFKKIVGKNWVSLKREVIFGKSKLDFLVDNKIIETKLFLNTISSGECSEKPILSKQSCKRFSQQYIDLIAASKNGYGTNVLYCYIYKADKMTSPLLFYFPKELTDIVVDSISNKVKHWQVNFEISKSSLRLISYRRI